MQFSRTFFVLQVLFFRRLRSDFGRKNPGVLRSASQGQGSPWLLWQCFALTSILRLRRTHHNLKEYEWRWMRCLDLKDWNCEELLLMYISNVCMDVVQVAWFQPSAVSCSSSVLVFLFVLHRRSKDGFDRAWYGCAQWCDFSWSSHRSSA